ncbi:MAG: hypothetical protein EON48_09775 [Acetobacteraceae bacterium]|jgi:hypothetical protein|nr:MAG: hypothetical protein EON48_09775 [Acetobacteraceae bacterium]
MTSHAVGFASSPRFGSGFFSLHALGTRIVTVAALLGGAAIGLPAQAQVQAADVAGVRLGSSPSEVEAALRALDPRFQFLKIYYAGPDGKASGAIGALKAAIQTGSDLRGIDWKRLDGFAVYFGQDDGKAYAIYRQSYSPAGFPLAQTLADLASKYGPSTGFYPTIYVRAESSAGQASNGCIGSGFGWTGGPGGFDPGCGKSIKVQFDPKSDTVAASFQTWLFDHRLAGAALRAAQARGQAAAQERSRKQLDAVKGNRPAL